MIGGKCCWKQINYGNFQDHRYTTSSPTDIVGINKVRPAWPRTRYIDLILSPALKTGKPMNDVRPCYLKLFLPLPFHKNDWFSSSFGSMFEKFQVRNHQEWLCYISTIRYFLLGRLNWIIQLTSVWMLSCVDTAQLVEWGNCRNGVVDTVGVICRTSMFFFKKKNFQIGLLLFFVPYLQEF